MPEFPVVNPIRWNELPSRVKRIATTRPHDYEIGPSTMEDVNLLAAKAMNAGYEVYLVEMERVYYASYYDLYREV